MTARALPFALLLALAGCGDKSDDSGASDGTDGADGASDGADGATDGADGASDGTDGATDGTDGATDGTDGTDGVPTPSVEMNTITVDGAVHPLIENGYNPCASDGYFLFSAAFGDTSLYYSLTAQYLNETDPASGRYPASEMLWNLRGNDASWGQPDDTMDVYLDNHGDGTYDLIWNDMATSYGGSASFTTSGWVRCTL